MKTKGSLLSSCVWVVLSPEVVFIFILTNIYAKYQTSPICISAFASTKLRQTPRDVSFVKSWSHFEDLVGDQVERNAHRQCLNLIHVLERRKNPLRESSAWQHQSCVAKGFHCSRCCCQHVSSFWSSAELSSYLFSVLVLRERVKDMRKKSSSSSACCFVIIRAEQQLLC